MGDKVDTKLTVHEAAELRSVSRLVAALTAQDPDWSESVMRSHVKAAWRSLCTPESAELTVA